MINSWISQVAVLVLQLDKCRALKIAQVYAPPQCGKLLLKADEAKIEEFHEDSEDAMKFRTT